MGFDNSCNTGLSLGLGSSSDQLLFFPQKNLLFDDDDDPRKKFRSSLLKISDQSSFPSLTLGLSTTEVARSVDIATTNPTKKVEAAGESVICLNRQSSSISTVSTFSNSSVKREREFSGSGHDQEVEEETKVSSNKVLINSIDDQDDQEGGARKKLRLTKEQSLVLEESFKKQSTLNPKQKHALAKHLNLSPRQVEVWFQNRRARTKLKQNELDCELLKTCRDSLTDENRRLKKEIQELKLIKLAAPFYMKFPAATLTICPSCEKIAGVSENSSKSPFPVGSKPQFFSGFTCPSAAPC